MIQDSSKETSRRALMKKREVLKQGDKSEGDQRKITTDLLSNKKAPTPRKIHSFEKYELVEDSSLYAGEVKKTSGTNHTRVISHRGST